MASDFLPASLGDLLSFGNGKTSPERFVEGAYPVYGSNGIIGFSDRFNADANTIVIGRVGSYCGSLYFSKQRCWITDNAIRACTKDNHDARFAYYLLETLNLNRMSVGSGQPLLNQGILSRIETSVPLPDEQSAISRVLGTLDDKIELNRRMNETLEGMARALFKSWFVDFGPVRAKAEGRSTGLPDSLAALFPDSFEDSELGPVPQGWKVGRLDDLVVLQRGFDLPSSVRVPGLHPVIAASGPSGTHNEAMVKGPGVTTGRSGVLGNVFYVEKDFWPLNTSLWVKEFKSCGPAYAYHMLRRVDFRVFNAGSAVPTLNRNHVHGLPTLLPSAEAIAKFEQFATDILTRQFSANRQSETLSSILDTLLPKLISGELRVQDAERIVGGQV